MVFKYAIKRKYKKEYIELLLRHGADLHQENKEGVSPYALKESFSNMFVIRLTALAVTTSFRAIILII
jgi:hypothetical protein